MTDQIASLTAKYDDQVSAGAKAAADALNKVGNAAEYSEQRVTRASKSGEQLSRQYDDTARLAAKVDQITAKYARDLEALEKSELDAAEKARLRTNIIATQEAAIQKAAVAHERYVAGLRALNASASANDNHNRAMVTASAAQAAAMDRSSESARRLNGFVGQLGFQVSDAANQIATGTNAFTVFGMQAGQLLGALGPLGAAVGAVVNVAGVAAGIIQKQADAAAEAARATDLLTVAQRAGLEVTESGVDKARRLRDERNEQAAASYRAAIAERELADAIAISAALSARSAMEQTQASNARYLAQGPGRFLGPAELSRIEYEKKIYEDTSKTAVETSKRLNEAQQAYESFRSGLNKTGGYSGEELDKLRERVDGTVSTYDEAALRTVTLRQKQEELGEAVKAGVITQTQADDILQKYTKHLDENSKAAKEAAKSARDREKAEEKLEKQILAAVKAADAKAVEEYNKVMGEGKRVYESARTPAEKYADELANLRRLLDYGAINQDTFNRAVQAADPAFQEAQKAAERYAQEVNRVAEDIAKDWSETLYDAIILRDKQTSIVDAFRDLFKRIAIEAIKANVILPITQQVVGAVPGLFGIQSPGTAANQNGGMGGVGGQALSLGSKFLPTGGITSAIDSWGYSALGIGTATSTVIPGIGGAAATTAATTINPATGSLAAYNSWGAAGAQGAGSGVAAGTGLSAYLGAAGAGAAGGGLVGGYLGTATNSKAVGGISGAVAGAGSAALASYLGFSALGGPVGLAIGAIAGAIMGMIGTQKATVGKTASADVTVAGNGKSATYGNIQTDNEGDPEAGKALGTALSGIFSIAAMGGGKLAKDFGIGSTAKNGLYVAGSVPYKEFGEDIAGLLRYTLLEQGGLQGGGANTIAALKATKAKDWEEATKDIALGASIDAGNTALKEMVKTLGGVTDAAKKATTESFAPMFEELARAQKLGIDGAYKALATDQLKAYLDQLRNPPNYTQMETDVATLTGQFAAAKEAYAQLNPAMVTYVDQIQKETMARIAANQNKDFDSQIAEASGRGYVNQISGFIEKLSTDTRSLAAVGEPATRANNLFNASLGGLLKTLTTDQLTDVVRTFGGDIGRLAQQIGAANDNVQQATQFETLFSQIRQENIQTEISALNEQKSAAQSTKTAWENLQKSAGNAVSSLLVSDYSTLSPEAKLKEAMRQFDDLTAKAAAGDVDAGTQAVAMKDTALGLARGFHASSEGYVSIFNHVSEGLTGVESVASRQVTLASQQVSRLDTQIAIQQNTLKALQVVPSDIAAIIKGINGGNSGDILKWSTTQDSSTQAQIKRAVLESYTNAQIEAAFGGFSDIQAARAADPGFNLAKWVKDFGIAEVMAGTRSIPGFATGTDSAPPGMAWVGEQGRELVQMAGGERVYPHSVSMDIARSWGVANDRWGGVAEFRRPAASGGGNAALIQRMERQNRLLEEQNQLLRQGNSTAGMVGDRVVSRLDGVKDEVRGSAARAEFTKKKVA